MKSGVKFAIVALLALAVAATFALRGGKRAEYTATPLQPAASVPAPERGAQVTAEPAVASAPGAVVALAKPRFLELGSMRCQACMEMAKVLVALRKSQGAKLRVDFVDVFEQPEAAERFKISLIPTQILYDAAGKEIFRHTGYFSHDDILAKFHALGVRL